MKCFKCFVLICIAVILFVSCDLFGLYQFKLCDDIAPAASISFSTATVSGTKWLYQLQDTDPADMTSSGFDIVVMDYSADGTEEGRYQESDIAQIKNSGKEVLAYLSIGEAEDYRYYFDSGWVSIFSGQPKSSAPCWLCRTNPEWKGNYKVQYWSEAWQQIILGYLDKIIESGFDGIYLDIIDAYEYWSDSDNKEGYTISLEEAALRMINFVKRIAFHARVTRGKSDFLIFPQNGEPILDYDTEDNYIKTINGIGIEDLYYNETTQINSDVTETRKTYLDKIQDEGKKVIVVDYVDDGSRPVDDIVNTFRSTALADGYYPYAAITDRALDVINTFISQP